MDDRFAEKFAVIEILVKIT